MFAPKINKYEHTFSVESRIHLHSANQSFRSTSYALTGNDRSISSIKFGSGVKYISNALGYSVKKLMNEHTYLKLFKMFTDEQNYSKQNMH